MIDNYCKTRVKTQMSRIYLSVIVVLCMYTKLVRTDNDTWKSCGCIRRTFVGR